MYFKSDHLYQVLRERIGRLPVGSRLPSVREIMREHNVSQVTVDKAIRKLKKQGLLYARVGEGTFTAEPGPRNAAAGKGRVTRIGLAIHDYPSPVTGAVVSNLQAVLGSAGYDLEIIRYSHRDRVSTRLRRRGLEAMLVMAPIPRLEASEILALKHMEVPTIMLTVVPVGIEQDAVGTDNELGGAMAAQHLAELGHRKIALLYSEPHGLIHEERLEGFRKQAELLGLPRPPVIDCNLTPGENSCVMAHRKIMELSESGALDFTALFVVSDASALGAMRAFHDLCLPVPERVSVSGFDDIAEASYFIPALTTLRQDFVGWAKAAAEILEKRLGGYAGPALQRKIKPRLITRGSTAAPAATDASLQLAEASTDAY